MRTFVTTMGSAAIIGFAGLGLATSAWAAPVQAPLSTSTFSAVQGGFAQSRSGTRQQFDYLRACVERTRIESVPGTTCHWPAGFGERARQLP